MEISIKWNMCRACTCCQGNSKLEPIFNSDHIAQRLREYAGVVMEENDGLPDKICTDCIQKLEAAHIFLSVCRSSDEHLKTLVKRTMSAKSSIKYTPMAVDNNATTTPITKPPGRSRKQDFQSKRYKLPSIEPPERYKLPSIEPPELKKQEPQEHEFAAVDGEDVSTELDAMQVATAAGTDMSAFLLENQTKLSTNEYIIAIGDDPDNPGFMAIASDSGDSVEHNLSDDVDALNLKYETADSEGVVAAATIENDAYLLNVNAQSVEHLIEEDFDQEPDHQVDEDSKPAISLHAVAHAVDLREACEASLLVPKANHSCSICGNAFPREPLLRAHMRTHRTSQKIYECEMCSKVFNAACNLTTHMRTHTGEKPYACGFCGRRFADRSTHRKHERIHTNERPFACKICGKAFSLSSSLKAHEAVHSHQKPYKCMACNKGFKLPHQLKAHENTHKHRYEAGMMYYDEDQLE